MTSRTLGHRPGEFLTIRWGGLGSPMAQGSHNELHWGYCPSKECHMRQPTRPRPLGVVKWTPTDGGFLLTNAQIYGLLKENSTKWLYLNKKWGRDDQMLEENLGVKPHPVLKTLHLTNLCEWTLHTRKSPKVGQRRRLLSILSGSNGRSWTHLLQMQPSPKRMGLKRNLLRSRPFY